jgi:antitoxin VapB
LSNPDWWNGGLVSLNIKDKEAYKLVRELADQTGESMTAAVKVAVRERLDRVRQDHDEDAVERWLSTGRRIRSHMQEPYLSIDHGDLLYDELGLPK